MTRVSNFVSSKGGLSPPRSGSSREYFHPLVSSSQDLSVTKSYFECSIWILNGLHTASYNNKKKKKKKKKAVILMLMLVCFLLYGHKCFVTNGRNSHFVQADAQYKALESEHTPH